MMEPDKLRDRLSSEPQWLMFCWFLGFHSILQDYVLSSLDHNDPVTSQWQTVLEIYFDSYSNRKVWLELYKVWHLNLLPKREKHTEQESTDEH